MSASDGPHTPGDGVQTASRVPLPASGGEPGPAAGNGHDHLPFVSGPQQVGAQDDGNVTGGHLVGVTGLRKLREELDQVPEDERVVAHSEARRRKLLTRDPR